ncbi:MAG: diguanylate cyclase domain-containing protein [Aquincola tertiaricarbonis]
MKVKLEIKAAWIGAAVVVVLIGLVGSFQHHHIARDVRAVLQTQQDALGASMAESLGDKLEMYAAVLEQGATAIDATVLADTAQLRRALARATGVRALFTGAFVVLPDGQLLMTEPPRPDDKPINLADRDYFQAVLAGRAVSLSAPMIARARHRAAVVMAVPLRASDGRLLGVLGGGIEIERDNLLGRLGSLPVGRGGHYEVVTQGADPVYIAHPDRSRLLKPASAAGHPGDLVTTKPVRRADWALRVVLPAAEVEAPIHAAQQRLLLQLTLLGGASALIGWLAMRRLLRPLTALHQAMRSWRASPGQPLRLRTSLPDERGELAREFEALARDARQREAELAAVSDASPLGLFRAGIDGRLSYVNDAYLRMHGVTLEEVRAGRAMLMPAEQREAALQSWHDAVVHGHGFSSVRRLQRGGGARGTSTATLAVRCAPLVVDGRLEGFVGTVEDVTERTAAEEKLMAVNAIFDATTDFVVQALPDGRITYMNPAARRAAGIGLNEPLGERQASDFHPAWAHERFRKEVLPAVLQRGVWVGDFVLLDGQGQERPISHMVLAHHGADGRIRHFSAVMRDVSAERQAEQEQRRQAATLRSMTEAIPAIMLAVGADGRFRFVNSSFERWHGLARGSVTGRTVQEVLGTDGHLLQQAWVARVLAGDTVRYETGEGLCTALGPRHLMVNLVPLRLDDHTLDGYVGVAYDISDRKEQEARLEALSRTDPLTGVLNRAGLQQRLDQLLQEARSGHLALLYIDLDHFKPVNDQHGHPAGDALLRQFAQRMLAIVRPTDTVARLGGDEFAILLTHLRERANADRVAAKVVQAASCPFDLDGTFVQVGASVGVAVASAAEGPMPDAATLIAQADMLLYRAKRAGGSRHMAEAVGA